MGEYIGIKIGKSNKTNKSGALIYYIRPIQQCMNQSRKVRGFTHAEIEEKKQKLINRWYAPKVIYYDIEGWVIGSNSKENALREYWKVCDVDNIGKDVEVNQVCKSGIKIKGL